MKKGKSFYLTNKEVESVLDTCSEWCNIMGEGEETAALVEERLTEGLGSALRKLYAGRNGSGIYSKYKTAR